MIARAADPATLFRPGSPSIGDKARQIDVPVHVPVSDQFDWQLNALFYGATFASASLRLRQAHRERA